MTLGMLYSLTPRTKENPQLRTGTTIAQTKNSGKSGLKPDKRDLKHTLSNNSTFSNHERQFVMENP